MMISTSIFIGLVLLFVICIARTIAGQTDDRKHQYETRIVQLEDGRYQVEEFNYDSADWYGEDRMVWWPINANWLGVGGEVNTLEEAKELQRKHQEKIDKQFRKKVIKVVED
jgi:hypothetical protein